MDIDKTIHVLTNENIGNLFVDQGDYWIVRFDRQSAVVKNSVGMYDLCYLLKNPYRRFTLIEYLQSRDNQSIHLDGGDTLLDHRGYHRLISELNRLDDEISRAELIGDICQLEELKISKDRINDYLAKTLNLSGKSRQLNSQIESERKRVGSSLRRAIKNIGRHLVLLENHLSLAINVYSSESLGYVPKQETSWIFDLEYFFQKNDALCLL